MFEAVIIVEFISLAIVMIAFLAAREASHEEFGS